LTVGVEINFWNVNVSENPVRSLTMPLFRTLIRWLEQQGKPVNGAIPVKPQCKQLLERMAPVAVVLTASSVIRVPQRVPQGLVLKAAAVETVITAALWIGQSIPQFHGIRSLRKVGEAVRGEKVVQEAFLLSEDRAVTVVLRLFVHALSFRETVVPVDLAGKVVQAAGVV
jgi:hypothetical protein